MQEFDPSLRHIHTGSKQKLPWKPPCKASEPSVVLLSYNITGATFTAGSMWLSACVAVGVSGLQDEFFVCIDTFVV